MSNSRLGRWRGPPQLWAPARLPDVPTGKLGQLVVALTETGEAHGKTNTFFRRLEHDESRRLAGAQFLEQFILHDDFGYASVRQAAHEPGPPDIGLVDLEPEAGRQQHAKWRHHAHQPAFLVGGLEHDHGQADIGTIFGRYALDQRALFGLGPRRRIAANLPVLVNGLDRALSERAPGGYERRQYNQQCYRKPQSSAGQGLPAIL